MSSNILQSLTFAWALVLASLPLTSLQAEESSRWTTWMFQGENDVLAISDPSDEHYTNGVRFLGLRHPEFAPRWAETFAGWWCSWACPDLPLDSLSTGFALGQNIYTPEDITVPELILDDRPYAGWLYGAALLQISDDQGRRQHSFELQLGIIGPESGAEWVQTELHELIDSAEPLGWDNQLPTEPAISLIYNYRRRLGGSNLDFIPHAGGALGTIMVTANVGATVRAGCNISGFPQTVIPTTAAPPSDDAARGAASRTGERPKWEFYLFAGAEGRAVGHNIFLDGTVFSDSHSVEREDFVYDLTSGLSLRYKTWRFQYTFVRRSEEFTPRRGSLGGSHNFGSLSIGVERSF